MSLILPIGLIQNSLAVRRPSTLGEKSRLHAASSACHQITGTWVLQVGFHPFSPRLLLRGGQGEVDFMSNQPPVPAVTQLPTETSLKQ